MILMSWRDKASHCREIVALPSLSQHVDIALAAGHLYLIQIFEKGASEFPRHPEDIFGPGDRDFPAQSQEIDEQGFGPLEGLAVIDEPGIEPDEPAFFEENPQDLAEIIKRKAYLPDHLFLQRRLEPRLPIDRLDPFCQLLLLGLEPGLMPGKGKA